LGEVMPGQRAQGVEVVAEKLKINKKGGAALTVTLGTPMLIEPQGMGDRFKTEFVGMGKGQFIIVRLPRIPGVNEHLYVEKKVTVRYVLHGNVYGFESEVLWTQAAPFRLLFLRYPSTIEILNLRKCQRVDCYLPVKVGVGEQGSGQYTEFEGMMLNLSCGGCQVVVDSVDKQLPPLSVDDDAALEFHMMGATKSTRIVGRAKNLSFNKNRMYLGVMFDTIPDDVRHGIDNYVNSVAEYLMS